MSLVLGPVASKRQSSFIAAYSETQFFSFVILYEDVQKHSACCFEPPTGVLPRLDIVLNVSVMILTIYSITRKWVVFVMHLQHIVR